MVVIGKCPQQRGRCETRAHDNAVDFAFFDPREAEGLVDGPPGKRTGMFDAINPLLVDGRDQRPVHHHRRPRVVVVRYSEDDHGQSVTLNRAIPAPKSQSDALSILV